jgi:hypothetical protein
MGGGLLVLLWVLPAGWDEVPEALFVMCVLSTTAGMFDAVLGWMLKRGHESHESTDRAEIGAWLWIGVPGILMWFALLLGRHPPSLLGAIAVALIVLAPLGVVGWALARIHLRRRWLANVATGLVPQWRIVRTRVQQRLPTLLEDRAKIPDGVLVRVQPAEMPFRDAERLEPVAVVALPEAAA